MSINRPSIWVVAMCVTLLNLNASHRGIAQDFLPRPWKQYSEAKIIRCITVSTEEIRKEFYQLLEQEPQLHQSKKSIVPILLRKRRLHEAYCLAEAKCAMTFLGYDNDAIHSGVFESCIEQTLLNGEGV